MENKLEKLLRGDKATYVKDEVLFVKTFEPGDDGEGIVIVCRDETGNIHATSVNEGYLEYIKFQEQNKPRTIEDGLKEGDIVSNSEHRYKILGVCGEVYFVSTNRGFNLAGFPYTLQELLDRNCTLEQPESSITEVTLEEVAKLKGISVDNLRIKE